MKRRKFILGAAAVIAVPTVNRRQALEEWCAANGVAIEFQHGQWSVLRLRVAGCRPHSIRARNFDRGEFESFARRALLGRSLDFIDAETGALARTVTIPSNLKA